MLNEKQKEAVFNQDRFVFLYAGAGTGKTTVMIEKIKYLIQIGYAPSSILGLTFTKEAAAQMRSRLNLENVSIETFHAWSYHHVKHMQLIPEDAPFSLKYLLKVSQYKNKHRTSKLPFVFHKYTRYLLRNDYIDYDDLLIKAINEKGFHKTYSFILIDEFQDTNYLQIQLLLSLIRKHTSVFAVGDPDQSIYRFRGAVPNVVDQFIQIFDAKTLFLTHNYRSHTYIIELANYLMSHDKLRVNKTLTSTSQRQGTLQFKSFKTVLEETAYLCDYIKMKRHNIAILCRTHRRVFKIKQMLHDEFMFYETKRIQILTIHQSKGLEFDHVIIVGLEQETIPGINIWNKEQLNEERRLLFVAITRAKISLLMTYVHTHGNPSQFLPELNLKTS
ncbi:MAG: ATP-dependent helicase [Acholeplasmataceae bacterium]